MRGLWEKPLEAPVRLREGAHHLAVCQCSTGDRNWRNVTAFSSLHCFFSYRDHCNVPARPPVRSQHRVHLFLPAALGHQGKRIQTVGIMSRARPQLRSRVDPPKQTVCQPPPPQGWHTGLQSARVPLRTETHGPSVRELPNALYRNGRFWRICLEGRPRHLTGRDWHFGEKYLFSHPQSLPKCQSISETVRIG